MGLHFPHRVNGSYTVMGVQHENKQLVYIMKLFPIVVFILSLIRSLIRYREIAIALAINSSRYSHPLVSTVTDQIHSLG